MAARAFPPKCPRIALHIMQAHPTICAMSAPKTTATSTFSRLQINETYAHVPNGTYSARHSKYQVTTNGVCDLDNLEECAV
jgi:hypothetical protein